MGLSLDPQAVGLRQRLQEIRDAGHVTNVEEDMKLRDPSYAKSYKTKGNNLFSDKRFADAASYFTQALEYDPFDHIFWSTCPGPKILFFNADRTTKL